MKKEMKKCSQQRRINHKEEPNGNSRAQKHNNKNNNKLEYKKKQCKNRNDRNESL